MSLKFIGLVMLIMGPLHIIFAERIGRMNKRWYDAMPFNSLVSTYTENTYRKWSIFSGVFMIVYAFFIFFA